MFITYRCRIFSWCKNYKQDKSAFRIAKYIAHELYNECDVPKENQDDDLRRASQWYIRQYGEDKIIAFLQREFIIKEISPTQKELGNFPWRRCYTLNYDEILERAYLENNKLLSSVTLSDESEQYRTSSVCVHLNGVISQLSRATIDNSFKLTYKSYNKDYIKIQVGGRYLKMIYCYVMQYFCRLFSSI